MAKYESDPSMAYEIRKEWQKPVIATLDFSETREGKEPGGADGAEVPGANKPPTS